MGSAGHVVQEFAPSFALAEGRVVTVEDSVKLEPRLAVTMLRGLALPRDMEKVPEDLQPSLVHASAYLVQVCPSLCSFILALLLLPSLIHSIVQAGQALLQSSNKVTLAAAERSRYHNDLKTEREMIKALKEKLKVAEARFEVLKKERDKAAGRQENMSI